MPIAVFVENTPASLYLADNLKGFGRCPPNAFYTVLLFTVEVGADAPILKTQHFAFLNPKFKGLRHIGIRNGKCFCCHFEKFLIVAKIMNCNVSI